MCRRHVSTPRRILIVNPFGIGDVLFTTPVIRALRQAFPSAYLGYLCNRRTEPVLRCNPHLNAVFVYEKDEIVRLWRAGWRQGLAAIARLMGQVGRARFDWVLDVSLGERYSFLLRCLGIPRLAGFDYRRRGRFLTEAFAIDGYQGDHVVEHYRRLLDFVGVRLQETALELVVSEQDERWTQQWLADHRLSGAATLIGLVPAGGVSWGIGAPFRRWSFEGFAAVADALIEQHGATVLLFGEAADAPICAKVARLMKRPAVDVSGQTTLGQFISLLGHLALVICNDGGPLHLAVGRRVKTVSIFGPVDPVVYGPVDDGRTAHIAVYREELPCRPCYHRFRLPPCPYERACLTMVEPAEVLAACRQLLGASDRVPVDG
ncbi:MAG: glycosyltransferase family 9 protein [Candidatus Omnitrophica bacterium]|nr:glycosyltransferase family 9 protein [Candidatus Omnitrophota bacterium]